MDSMRMLGILFFSYVFTVSGFTIASPESMRTVMLIATPIMLVGTAVIGVYARLTGR